jgi:hypothetical protein
LLKQVSIDDELNGGFENAVFSKIRRKKTQRRVAVATSVVFGLMGFLFGFFLFGPQPEHHTPIYAHNQVQPENFSDKEEIPVLEDVYLSSYDNNSTYAVETVSYQEDEGQL